MEPTARGLSMLFPAEQGLKQDRKPETAKLYEALNAISSRTRIETLESDENGHYNLNSQCYFQQNKD